MLESSLFDVDLVIMKYKKPKFFSGLPLNVLKDDSLRTIGDEILNKSESALTTSDFSIIFSKLKFAASYEDACYFLDLCFEHLKKTKNRLSNYPKDFLRWFPGNQARLIEDELWDICCKEIHDGLKKILSEFELFEWTEAECAEVDLDYNYSIGPYDGRTLVAIIENLSCYDCFANIIDKTLNYLELDQSIASIQWYVSISSLSRSWVKKYEFEQMIELQFKHRKTALVREENFKLKEKIFHRLHRFEYLAPKMKLAREEVARNNFHKYNGTVSL